MVSSDNSEEAAVDYSRNLSALIDRIKQFSDAKDDKVSEVVVEGLFSKILVSKDEFQWHFRTKDSDDRSQSPIHYKMAEFVLTKEDALKFRKNLAPNRRLLKWEDLHVSVWL
mgnify:CR=1 FL=1